MFFLVVIQLFCNSYPAMFSVNKLKYQDFYFLINDVYYIILLLIKLLFN